MNELLRYLDSFAPTLRRAQYALNSDWEQAVEIDLDAPDTPPVTVDTSIAVELFYELNDGRTIFLGVRYAPELALAKSPQQFFTQIINTLRRAAQLSPRETLELLGTTLNNDARTYTAQPIHHVELGIEGHWKSEGSTVLRKAGEPPLTSTLLEERLQASPQLLQNSKGTLALEFAVTAPESWVGVQISTAEEDVHTTDTALLLELVNRT